VNSEELQPLVEEARREGREVAVIVGLGFVGTAVAASLFTARGAGRFFVIGVERDTPDGRRKVEALHAGRAPFASQDRAVDDALSAAASDPRRLCATTDPGVVRFADVVLVCTNVDLVRASGQTEQLEVRLEGVRSALETIGEHLRPDALVIVESTLPVGASDLVLYPALCTGAARSGRDVASDPPLYAYCYERVTPGPDYLASVHRTPRSFAGIDARSAARARGFLGGLIDFERYPAWEHRSTRAAELAKLLENAYRATNIAFVDEWARVAEQVGVDLFDIVRSIRVRKGTHDNLMLPGLGVGGYCLTKDALLAAWGVESLLDGPAELPFSRRAILVNEAMPLRAVHAAEAHFGDRLRGSTAALFGITYRAGVEDTRSSPTEILARALIARGVRVRAHDPLARVWPELPDVPLTSTPDDALDGAVLAVVCLPDAPYAASLAPLLARRLPSGGLLIDAWNAVADVAAGPLGARGVATFVYGRGDLPKPRRGGA